MDQHAPDGHAPDDGSHHNDDQDKAWPGEPAAPVSDDADGAEFDVLAAESTVERVAHAPWLSPAGGPAVRYLAYVDFDPSAGVEEQAELLVETCQPHGISVEVKGVDEYRNADELKYPYGIFCVLSSSPRKLWRPGNPALFRRIINDFRALHPIRAADGFLAGSERWHRVRVVQVFHTDDALEDEDCRWIIDQACARYNYTPGVPFAGNIFDIFKPGMAQLIKESDRVTTSNLALWRFLLRWGVDSANHAQIIRDEIEKEVGSLEDTRKRAMYRPIDGIDQNQLWLVLHDTEARPPADPNKTTEENAEDVEKFVANGARAVRVLVKRLESTYSWFQQPENAKRRGGQAQFARLYDALRSVTGYS